MRYLMLAASLLVATTFSSQMRAEKADFTGMTPPPLVIDSWLNTKEDLNLSALRGRVVLLEFWATWWGPCRSQIPHLNELYEKYKNKGLVIIGVSSESESVLSKFMEKTPIKYPVAVDTGSKTTQAYSITSYPTAYLVGPNGKVLGSNYSESAIEEALKDAKMYFQQELTNSLKEYSKLLARKQYGKAHKKLSSQVKKLTEEDLTVGESLLKDLESYAKSYLESADQAIASKDMVTAISNLQMIQVEYKGSDFEKEAKSKLNDLKSNSETKTLYKGALILMQAEVIMNGKKPEKALPLLEQVVASFPDTPMAKQAQTMIGLLKK